MASDDEWSDDEPTMAAPKVIETRIVTKDFIPETNDVLPLILDETVYVFDKTPTLMQGVPKGYWYGEVKGVTGFFDPTFTKFLPQ